MKNQINIQYWLKVATLFQQIEMFDRTGLFFECWNLFLALGYSVYRAIKVLVIAILHVGRIDTPVLAKRNTVLKLSAYFVSVLHALSFALATPSHWHQYVFPPSNNRIYNRRFSTSILHSRLFITWSGTLRTILYIVIAIILYVGRVLFELSCSDYLSKYLQHRHPYMELLGKIYLYKLRYGDRFVTEAGTCWRLLFVLTLMPWLEVNSFQDIYNQSQ